MIKFLADTHSYLNIDPNEDLKWTSVTGLLHNFIEPFDEIKISENCSKGNNPKYKGIHPAEIRKIWKDESDRSIKLGSWYHDQREKQTLNFNTITRDGIELPIISPILTSTEKIAPDQKITNGLYPEHLIYLKSAKVCGQADRVEVVNGRIDLYDYKTSKEIKTEGFKFRDGRVKKMLPPLQHLDDCEFNHYALQLSCYMYMMLKHNYNLQPGTIQIDHISFEVEGENKMGYPIVALDAAGDPIIKKVTPIKLPYLKNEVIVMFKWLMNNPKTK